MSDTGRFDPNLPVKDILARYPQLSSALAAHGLDTCCGGMHPLKDACAAKGKDLAEVVRDLESAHAATESHSLVPPTMSIRELSRRFPSTRAVLEQYGLGDCGGDEGPDEPLAWFATVHRLPLDDFLRDIRQAALRDAAAAPSPAPAPANARPFSPHFIAGSLFLTLTLGATTGMINLLRIAAGADVPLDHRQIHGHTQVLGFATLFLMGIAYHALPRILGIGGASPGRSVRVSFWLMFAGVLLRNAGQPLGLHPIGRLLSLRLRRDGARLGASLRPVPLRPARQGARRQVRPRRIRCSGSSGPPPSTSSPRSCWSRPRASGSPATSTRCCRPRSTSRSISRRSTGFCSRSSTGSATGSCRSFSASARPAAARPRRRSSSRRSASSLTCSPGFPARPTASPTACATPGSPWLPSRPRSTSVATASCGGSRCSR